MATSEGDKCINLSMKRELTDTTGVEFLGKIGPQMTADELEAILAHCTGCVNNLMYRNLFDLEDPPEDAKITNMSKCYVQKDPTLRNRDTSLIKQGLEFREILEKSTGDERPYILKMEGDAGTGKSTWMERLVYLWADEFLQKKNHMWKLLVLVPAKSIECDIEKAFQRNLFCNDQQQKIIMKYFSENKSDVGILIDGIDEIRDQRVIEKVKKYVRKVKKECGPMVLISSRTNLCKIPSEDFDKLLQLEGFTKTQGLEYIDSYLTMEELIRTTHLSRETVMKYVRDHLTSLQPVLQNPLQLHLFCALYAQGILKLHPDAVHVFPITTLLESLEGFLIQREMEKPDRVSRERREVNFYKLCLYGLLSNIREFSPDQLTQFDVSDIYKKAFLKRRVDRDDKAGLIERYFLTHNIIYEFFGASYFKACQLNSAGTKALLLSVCATRQLRNVQKIIIEQLSKRGNHTGLTIRLIQLIILCQVSSDVLERMRNQGVKPDLIDKVSKIKSSMQIPISAQARILENNDASNNEEVWKEVSCIFYSFATLSKEHGLFHELLEGGDITHIVECLKVFPFEDKNDIVEDTIYKLLPAKSQNHNVKAAGNGRWTEDKMSDKGLEIHSWCPRDVLAVLQEYRNKPLKNVTLALGIDIVLPTNCGKYRDMWWGTCPAEYENEDEWKLVIEELLKPEYAMTQITVLSQDTRNIDSLLNLLKAAGKVIPDEGKLPEGIVVKGVVTCDVVKTIFDISSVLNFPIHLQELLWPLDYHPVVTFIELSHRKPENIRSFTISGTGKTIVDGGWGISDDDSMRLPVSPTMMIATEPSGTVLTVNHPKEIVPGIKKYVRMLNLEEFQLRRLKIQIREGRGTDVGAEQEWMDILDDILSPRYQTEEIIVGIQSPKPPSAGAIVQWLHTFTMERELEERLASIIPRNPHEAIEFLTNVDVMAQVQRIVGSLIDGHVFLMQESEVASQIFNEFKDPNGSMVSYIQKLSENQDITSEEMVEYLQLWKGPTTAIVDSGGTGAPYLDSIIKPLEELLTILIKMFKDEPHLQNTRNELLDSYLNAAQEKITAGHNLPRGLIMESVTVTENVLRESLIWSKNVELKFTLNNICVALHTAETEEEVIDAHKKLKRIASVNDVQYDKSSVDYYLTKDGRRVDPWRIHASMGLPSADQFSLAKVSSILHSLNTDTDTTIGPPSLHNLGSKLDYVEDDLD